jgi:hypothetical protein
VACFVGRHVTVPLGGEVKSGIVTEWEPARGMYRVEFSPGTYVLFHAFTVSRLVDHPKVTKLSIQKSYILSYGLGCA